MTTPQDLLIVAMDVESSRPVETGDLSLVLAGAELVDLLGEGLVTLDGDFLVPEVGRTPGDRLLAEAAAALVRQLPYESVEDWLWRRGRALSAAYLAELESQGQVTRKHRRLLPGLLGSRRAGRLRGPPPRRRALAGARAGPGGSRGGPGPARRVAGAGPRGRRRGGRDGAGDGRRRGDGAGRGQAAAGHRAGGLRQRLARRVARGHARRDPAARSGRRGPASRARRQPWASSSTSASEVASWAPLLPVTTSR